MVVAFIRRGEVDGLAFGEGNVTVERGVLPWGYLIALVQNNSAF